MKRPTIDSISGIKKQTKIVLIGKVKKFEGPSLTTAPRMDRSVTGSSKHRITHLEYLSTFFREERMCSEDSCVDLRARNCARCKEQFLICKPCDRGHIYCSPKCSTIARWESKRRARRRHRSSPEGRLDHMDRERVRRARKRIIQRSVGDHGSKPDSTSCNVSVAPSPARDSASRSIGVDTENGDVLRCSICGSPGRFVRFGSYRRRFRKDFRFRC